MQKDCNEVTQSGPEGLNAFPDYGCIGRTLTQSDLDKIRNVLMDIDSWQAHVNRQNYEGSWDVIPLRCLSEHKNAHPILQSFSLEQPEPHQSNPNPVEWLNLPMLSRFPILAQFIKEFPCSIKSARFMRLCSGSEILPHRDHGVGLAFGEARLHIPICAPEGVDFYSSGSIVPMQEGELWYINVDKAHWVKNNSKKDRIHFVFDCHSNQWLLDLITQRRA